MFIITNRYVVKVIIRCIKHIFYLLLAETDLVSIQFFFVLIQFLFAYFAVFTVDWYSVKKNYDFQ